MPIVADQRQTKGASEARTVSVSFDGALASGETLSSPTVSEVSTNDLTIDTIAVNGAAIEVLGQTVAVGRAVQFRVSGGTAGTRYTIRVTTSTSNSQTLVLDLVLSVV